MTSRSRRSNRRGPPGARIQNRPLFSPDGMSAFQAKQ
jgi:hypothetical protein